MMAMMIGLFSGATLGLSTAPLWMMLQLPMRISDVLDAGNMRLCALALGIGTSLGALAPVGFLPLAFGILVMLLGGIFVGMFAAALIEAIEVIPILFDRLSVTADMRFAAAALAFGKTAGAIIAGLMGV